MLEVWPHLASRNYLYYSSRVSTGFATVHRGLDRLSNEFVAVKVVGLQNLPNEEAYSSFQEVDKTQYFPSDSSLEREVYILSEAR